jgi:hypothetical protein
MGIRSRRQPGASRFGSLRQSCAAALIEEAGAAPPLAESGFYRTAAGTAMDLMRRTEAALGPQGIMYPGEVL